MPFTTYGLLKAVRSHTINSPSVQESVESGRPNACNGCHLDKPLAWTARYLSSWYGIEAPELDADEQEIAASALWLLRGNAGQRVLAAYSMGWTEARKASGTAWMAPLLAELLDDPYDAVRLMAHRSLRDLEGMEELHYEFTAPPRRRSRRRQRAVELWEARAAPVASERRAAVLIDEQGHLRRREIERLLRSRDNRPMMLWE
jgi:hypothetical protein